MACKPTGTTLEVDSIPGTDTQNNLEKWKTIDNLWENLATWRCLQSLVSSHIPVVVVYKGVNAPCITVLY